MKETNKGFTLIELLITIAIIAVLSALGIVAYSTVLKQGRDSKRQSDLRAIQSALEQYYSDQGFYPVTLPSSGALSSGGKTYINNIPADPVGNPQYSYVASGTNCAEITPQNCISYCLYAHLENPSSNYTMSNVCVSYNPDSSKYNFALTPP